MPTYPVVTCNDDFTTAATNVPRLTSRVYAALRGGRPVLSRALAVLVQEGKRTPLRDRVPDGYAVRQYETTQAMAGVAVVWDMTQARPAGTNEHDPRKIGHGIQAICYPDGTRMLTRYVVWQDVEVGAPGSQQYLRLASYHRPPPRYDHLWPAADAELARWVAKSPIPVLLGSDVNTKRFRRLAKRLGFRGSRGVGIDCLMARGRVWFAGFAVRLAKGSSDHNPVRVFIRVGRWKDR